MCVISPTKNTTLKPLRVLYKINKILSNILSTRLFAPNRNIKVKTSKFAINNKLAKIFITLSFACTTTKSFSSAEELGLGLIVGSPSGISLEKPLNDTHSIDALLAYSKDKLRVHATYLTKFYLQTKINEVNAEWYYGLGGGLWVRDDNNDKDQDVDTEGLFARFSIGMNFIFPESPIKAFAELGINGDVFPQTDAMITAGIGARYYF